MLNVVTYINKVTRNNGWVFILYIEQTGVYREYYRIITLLIIAYSFLGQVTVLLIKTINSTRLTN